jgi:hypothetical protein
MDQTDITKVHVVKTDSNYTETVKNAAIAGVVTVLATAATQLMLAKLTDRVKLRQDRNAAEKIVEESKKDPKE